LAALLHASRAARAAAAAADIAAVAKAHAQRLARSVKSPEAAVALLTELRMCGAITPEEAMEAHALVAAAPVHAAPHARADDALGPPWPAPLMSAC
jgi:hypothetical protein